MKIICLVALFFMSILVTFILIFINDIPVLSSLFNEYITSGNSFFIPILPYINLLGFIPEEHQIFQLSLGHLLDIIIIVNIFSSIERSVYQYYTRICLSEQNLIFINMGTYFFEPKENLSSLSQDPNINLNLRDKSREYLKDLFLEIKIRRHRKWHFINFSRFTINQ